MYLLILSQMLSKKNNHNTRKQTNVSLTLVPVLLLFTCPPNTVSTHLHQSHVVDKAGNVT